jgi:hypothetical protein
MGEQDAGLDPVEGQHQRRRLSVDAHPIQRRVEVLGGVPAKLAPGHTEAFQLLPAEQPAAVRRPRRVSDGDVADEAVHEVGRRHLGVAVAHQNGEEGGWGHRHGHNLVTTMAPVQSRQERS